MQHNYRILNEQKNFRHILTMILILTDSNDVHADVVSMKLGDNYFRLNLDIEALKDTKISFDGSEWTISQNGKKQSKKFIRKMCLAKAGICSSQF